MGQVRNWAVTVLLTLLSIPSVLAVEEIPLAVIEQVTALDPDGQSSLKFQPGDVVVLNIDTMILTPTQGKTESSANTSIFESQLPVLFNK